MKIIKPWSCSCLPRCLCVLCKSSSNRVPPDLRPNPKTRVLLQTGGHIRESDSGASQSWAKKGATFYSHTYPSSNWAFCITGLALPRKESSTCSNLVFVQILLGACRRNTRWVQDRSWPGPLLASKVLWLGSSSVSSVSNGRNLLINTKKGKRNYNPFLWRADSSNITLYVSNLIPPTFSVMRFSPSMACCDSSAVKRGRRWPDNNGAEGNGWRISEVGDGRGQRTRPSWLDLISYLHLKKKILKLSSSFLLTQAVPSSGERECGEIRGQWPMIAKCSQIQS